MNDHGELERRYRGLLAWYPRVYWRDHEEEMLAVLLAGSRPGQLRPSFGEAVSLLWHAMWMRLGQDQPGPSDSGSDALAMFSAAAPLVMLGPTLLMFLSGVVGLDHSASMPLLLHEPGRGLALYRYFSVDRLANYVPVAAAGQLALTGAVLLGLRRTAFVLVVGLVGSWLIFAASPDFFAPRLAGGQFFLTYYLLEGAALLLSPGPRRGLRLLRRRSAALIAAATTFTVAWMLSVQSPQTRQSVHGLVTAVAILCAIAIAVALASRAGRYLVILFLIMFYAYALYLGERTGHVALSAGLGPVMLFYLPGLLAACATVAAAKRRRIQGRLS